MSSARSFIFSQKKILMPVALISAITTSGCVSMAASQNEDANMEKMGKNPMMEPVVSVDRFSKNFAHLLVRTSNNGLPGPNEPVDFDQKPFVTQGLTPDGNIARYYNFDVQSTKPAPIYVLFREGESKPVEGQLNVVDVIPGDEGYNDFWNVNKVTVPSNYVANTITDLRDIKEGNYKITKTKTLVNCPVVPDGSTAKLRTEGKNTQLVSGWYKGKVVKYFTFEESKLETLDGENVSTSPIYVTFNKNPNVEGGGPASGFRVETNGIQTHNVLQTIPMDIAYSPLWSVSVYNNKDWGSVKDVASALDSHILASDVATVNCPVVYVGTTVAKLELN